MRDLEENLDEYISENISFLTYRERRARYINKFVGSEYRPDDTIPLKFVNNDEALPIPEIAADASLQAENMIQIEPDSTNKKILVQYLSLALLISVATATWFFASGSNEVKRPAAVVQTEKIEKPKIVANIKDKNFIISFVNRDQWDTNTISEFLIKWKKIPRLTKKEVKLSQSFVRLKNSLRLRIQEQAALQSIKNKPAERQENLLKWFASQLTIAVR